MQGWRFLWHGFTYLPMIAVACLSGVTTDPKVILPALYVASGCWLLGILRPFRFPKRRR